MRKFDAIVIGSGIGGLVSAGVLASGGLHTLLMERNGSPGGYLSSFRRRGYVFDSAVDCISGAGREGLFQNILSMLGVDKEIDFVPVEPVRVSIFPDMEIAVDRDVKKYMETLSFLFPSESNGIRRLFSMADRIHNALQRAITMRLTGEVSPESIDPALLRVMNISYEEFLSEYISDYRLRAVFSDRCPFMGLPPSQVSALSMLALIMSYFRYGAYRPAGGFQRLADTLAEGFVRRGGEIIFNCTARSIILKGTECCGVISDDGREYLSRDIVSNADFVFTFRDMLGGRYADIAKKMIRNPGVSTSFFILYCGIRGEAAKYSSMGYFLSYNMEDLFLPGMAFTDNSTIGITTASIEDELRAPEGCHTIVIHEMVDSTVRISDKQALTENLLNRAETLIPGLKDRIEIVDAATPRTLHRYTGNFRGAAFGWRQIPGMADIRKHGIDNLYIAGHWGDMGGGVLAAAYSGLKAASEILLKKGIRFEFQNLCSDSGI